MQEPDTNIFNKAMADNAWDYNIFLENGKVLKVSGISGIERFQDVEFIRIEKDQIKDCESLVGKDKPRGLMIRVSSIIGISDADG